jgi:hypothetical protein
MLYKAVNKIDNVFFHLENYDICINKIKYLKIGETEHMLEYRSFISDDNYIHNMIKQYKYLLISIFAISPTTVICPSTFSPIVTHKVSCAFLTVVGI